MKADVDDTAHVGLSATKTGKKAQWPTSSFVRKVCTHAHATKPYQMCKHKKANCVAAKNQEEDVNFIAFNQIIHQIGKYQTYLQYIRQGGKFRGCLPWCY